MEELKQGFIDEALLLVETLEELLIQLECRSVENADIEEIFRIMHTLKGSAAMFGFSNTERITHNVEDIYDLIRERKLGLTPEIINLTIQTTDVTKELLHNEDQISEELNSAFSSIIQTAENFNFPGTDSRNKDFDSSIYQNSEPESYDTKSTIYYILFKPDSDVLLRGINPVNVFEELTELGTTTGFPYIEDVPLPEDYDPSIFYLAWDIFLQSKSPKDDIEDCFLFFMEHEFRIIPVNPEDLSTNKEFLKTCITFTKGLKTLDEISENIALKFNVSQTQKKIEPRPLNDGPEGNIKEPKKHIDSIKVAPKKLDELINLVSELVTLNSRLEIISEDINNEALTKTIKSVSKLSKKFRDNALELRLMPVKVLILKMKRLIRDLSRDLNKNVEFITEGTNTELDKNIIAKLEVPLMHILRNSLDHGIETTEERVAANKPEQGVIRFISFYSGANVYIQIQDDGRGIDIEQVRKKAADNGFIDKNNELTKQEIFNLLFTPGFTTTSSVTNVSGRGVGLDVVKKEITDMRGEIDIESEKGLGTSFTLKLPLTLSIIDTFMVMVDSTKILIPREYIVQTQLIPPKKDLKQPDRAEFDGRVIPTISLREDFKCSSIPPIKEKNVIVSQYDKFYAITVDKIIGEHQAVVKPLGHYNQNHEYFSGASILGDGSLAFILDINKVISMKKSKSNVGNYNLK